MPTTVVPLSARNPATFEQLPLTCAECKAPIAAEIVYGRYLGLGEDDPRLYVVFVCPRDACGALFAMRYRPADGSLTRWKLDSDAGVKPPKAVLPREVVNFSHNFATIYQESVIAEWFDLGNVAGVGFRKALEFLVKDFALHVAKSDEEKLEIYALPLAKAIARHIADPHARAVASRAAWLGNDETHYARIWIDKDRADLKRLIALTVAWIVSYLEGERYLREMPEA